MRRRPTATAWARAGARAGQSSAAPPTRSAGEPAHRWSARTRPNTADPGAISARRPIRVPGSERAARPDRRLSSDAHLADPDDVTVDPVAGQIDLGLDARAVADLQHPRDRGERVHVDVAADLGPERAGVVADPRCTGQTDGVHLVGDLLGEPQPDVHMTAARVIARSHPGEQDACGNGRDRHPSERGREDQQRRSEHPPVHGRERLKTRHEMQHARCRSRGKAASALR